MKVTKQGKTVGIFWGKKQIDYFDMFDSGYERKRRFRK